MRSTIIGLKEPYKQVVILRAMNELSYKQIKGEPERRRLVLRIRKRMIALLSGTCIIALLIGMFSDVYIFSVLAYLLLATSLLVFIWKVDGKGKKYWISGICMQS